MRRGPSARGRRASLALSRSPIEQTYSYRIIAQVALQRARPNLALHPPSPSCSRASEPAEDGPRFSQPLPLTLRAPHLLSAELAAARSGSLCADRPTQRRLGRGGSERGCSRLFEAAVERELQVDDSIARARESLQSACPTSIEAGRCRGRGRAAAPLALISTFPGLSACSFRLECSRDRQEGLALIPVGRCTLPRADPQQRAR